MKNVYVSVLALLLFTGLNAQTKPKGMLETGSLKPAKFEGKVPQKKKTNALVNKTVLFSETFAGTMGAFTTSGPDALLWLNDLDGPNGAFSDPVAEIITSTTAANGFMIFDTDLSNPDISNPTPRVAQLVSPVIDVSSNPFVAVTFEHTIRFCCSGTFIPTLEVTTDGFATFASFDVSEGTTANQNFGTMKTTVNVAGFLDTVSNHTNFQFRFNWDGTPTDAADPLTGATHYFWQIDDVMVETLADNNLTLDNVLWGTTGAWGTVSYATVPQSQMTPVSFTGIVTNNGATSQDAVFTASEVSTSFTSASTATALAPLAVDGLGTIADFTGTGIGQYNFDFSVGSGTADADPSDNAGKDSLMVSDYIYALEHGGPASGGNNGTNPYMVGNIFNIVNDVTLYAADFRISTLATMGATYYISVFEVNTAATTLETLFTPVYKSDPYLVGTTGEWMTMPLAVPQNLTGGKAYALFLESTGDGFYYNYNGETDPFFNSVFVDLSADTAYYTSNNPAYLRMNFTPPPVITSSDADNNICSPATLTLTSSANTGNLWSTGETTKSITVNASGTYYVSVNGMYSSNVDVVVGTAEAITAATGTNPTSCLGTDGKIDVTFGGAGNGTISWSGTASGSLPNVTASASITGLSAGGYSVTYDNGTGCLSAPMSVALSDPGATIPVITAGGATTFCSGGNVTLTSSAVGGNVWSTTETTDAITVSTSGFYYTANMTAGCVGISNVIEVIANALPTVDAGADAAVCTGGSVFLFGSGATVYTWDNGVTDATMVTPTATTTYTLTGMDGNGCINTDAITITVNAYPTITWGAIAPICVYNGPRALDALPAGGTYSGTGVSGSSFDPDGIAVGTYSLDYAVTVSGCTSFASQTIAVDSCLSINTLDQDLLSVYPNPTSGKITVSSENLNQYDVIELKDQLGRTVGTWKINNVVMNIETKNIAKGNYLLVVRGNNGEMMKKIQMLD